MGKITTGAFLDCHGRRPAVEELDTIAKANGRDNPIEEVMRLRAIGELSETLDTDALLGLAKLAVGDPRSLARMIADHA